MRCCDCHGAAEEAVAICGRCGAGLCRDHTIVEAEQLTVRRPIAMQLPAAVAARRLRCGTCQAAEAAQARGEVKVGA